MDELVIEIGCTGVTEALHTDNFDLGFLGDKKVRRQTDILFNESTQKWNIRYLGEDIDVSNSYLSGFDTYDSARAFEVTWVNDCRLTGVAPESEEGMALAKELRG